MIDGDVVDAKYKSLVVGLEILSISFLFLGKVLYACSLSIMDYLHITYPSNYPMYMRICLRLLYVHNCYVHVTWHL